ncbi:hypothetical protein ACFYVL_01210 [Streptomyces sp. NPDC004111]|uniref:hypothetical protein n=1 Tax=Streptomyces sp. NPDC004111 TaxID=3364690 RepID=UPI0036B6165D
MRKPENSSYPVWSYAHEVAYANPIEISRQPCPECGERTLNLVYIVEDLEDGVGLFSFWCGSCLFGIMPRGNTEVPPGGAKVKSGQEQIPNYTLVWDE